MAVPLAYTPAVSTTAFDHPASIEDTVRMIAAAGFEAVEFAIQEEGLISFSISGQACIETAKHAAEAGVAIAGVLVVEPVPVNLGSSDAALRERASEHIIRSLDAAVLLGANVVTVTPAALGTLESTSPLTSYEDAWHQSLEALLRLRFEAEHRGISLACLTGAHRFLMSPMELRRFVDRCNSAWVGAALDLGSIVCLGGYPQDWVRILGHNTLTVRFSDFRRRTGALAGYCALGEGDVDWPALRSALRAAGYAGPAIFAGVSSDLNSAKVCLERVLGPD